MLTTVDRQKHVEVVGLQFGRDAHRPNAIGAAYRRAIDEFGPTRFLQLEKALHLAFSGFSLDQLLAVIRWAHYDHVVFVQAVPRLLKVVADGLRREDGDALHDTVDRVWRSYYFMGEAEDVAFKIGRVLLEAGRPEAAHRYFEQSEDQHGSRASTAHAIARCETALAGAHGATDRGGAR